MAAADDPPRLLASRNDGESLPQYNALMELRGADVDTALRELVDEYRHRCLWFLRPDYYPSTIAEADRVLDAIQRHGDRDGFRRAAQVREWLSQPTSATSAGS